MRVSIIVAAAENGVIGRAGRLPWRIPTDLKHFRQLTLGKPMIMGRKTYESIGRPLDGRDTIVVTRRADLRPAGVHAAHTLDQALEIATELAHGRAADEIMVIGGTEVFAAAVALAGRIYLTRVHGRPEGDTFWPELPAGTWREVGRRSPPQGPEDDYACTLLVLERHAYVPAHVPE